MLVSNGNIQKQNNYTRTVGYYPKTVNIAVSVPKYDTVSFKSKEITAKQALKFIIPLIVGGTGLTQLLPDNLLKKVYNIELEEAENNLFDLYGTSKTQEIKSHIAAINNIVEEYPDKLKIIENLLRKDVFNSLGNVSYLMPEKLELFNKQLEFLNNMIKNKKYLRHVDASQVYNHKTKVPYSIKDFEAKQKILDYLQNFNNKYEASERWKEDKLNIDSWTIGYQQVDIINATNDFNLELMMEMVKSKTTFIDNICPDDEVKAYDIPQIGYNLNEQNIDYVRKMFLDKTVSKDAIVGLSQWIEKNSMSQYKKLNENSNIPKEYVGEIGAILNDYNYDFVMGLVQNNNIPKKEIAKIGKYYNENSADILKYLVKHIQDERIKNSKEKLWSIGFNINKENKKYIEQLCKNTKVSLEIIDEVTNIVNNDNFNIITILGTQGYAYPKEIKECASQITKKNKNFVETLCSEYQMKVKDINSILNDLYYLENSPLKLIGFYEKCSILNTHAEYGELMKKCGIDYETKISEIANSIQSNIENVKSNNLQEFLSQILSNNNSEAENVLKTYDFAQFGKQGIPLKYSRKDFIENLEQNILSGIKAEDRKTILEHFGMTENEDFDGLWNNQEIDKSQLISEKGRKASDKIKTEIDRFMLQNDVVSNDKEFNKVLNGLIKGFPSFVPLVGKLQHGTHDYSVDIHTLKVLQSCLNNPLYKELSNEGKTILKLSALMHDIGKNGKVRDPGHAHKSAEYVGSILNNINLPDDVKSRIINIVDNHHWFADYNEKSLTPQTVAAKTRTKEDFLIYQILAKADLASVNGRFHFGVTNTSNEKEYKAYFDRKMKPIQDTLEKIALNTNFVFHTKILNNGNKFPVKEVTLKNGKKVKIKVLNLSELPKETDLEQYGFPKGTTVENARFLVHMTQTGTYFDVVYALAKSHNNSSAWSTSLISVDNQSTYGNRPYGFIFDVRQENISEAYYNNTSSGSHKDMNVFEKILLDFDKKERTYLSKNFRKELKKQGIWLNDESYANLVDYLKKKKHITAINKDIQIGKKTIKANTIVKCLQKSQDALFGKDSEYNHNEIVVINPKIQGLIAKYEVTECNDDFLMFASQHNLPVVIIG